jgi:hypothetical protein
MLRLESRAFLQKSSKKLLLIWSEVVSRPSAREQKFFGSFFQKRTSCCAEKGVS